MVPRGEDGAQAVTCAIVPQNHSPHTQDEQFESSYRLPHFDVVIPQRAEILEYSNFRLAMWIMYSIMLHMKTRVTFRISDELAETLREVPNQTAFVEQALRDALGRTCPACHGFGRIPMRALAVTNIRQSGMRRLSRDEALHLRKVFRLGQQVAATRIDLERKGRRVLFRMLREQSELINGTLVPTAN